MTRFLKSMRLRGIGVAAVFAGVAGAVMGLCLAFMTPEVTYDRWSYPLTPTHFTWMQVGFVVQHIPCVLALLAATVAVGQGAKGRIGWYVGVTGMALLTVNEALAILARNEATDSAIADTIGGLYGFCSLLIAIGLMVGGAAAVRAGIWGKPESWLLFILGAWMLVPAVPVLIIWPLEPSRIVLSVWVLLFAALGVVIARKGAIR